MANKHCPLCGIALKENNVDNPPYKDFAGRALCKECKDWLNNTEWD